jgi:NAD(P)-dependent dehydrogenase (short-subunit alcohol dehydrogenase family)
MDVISPRTLVDDLLELLVVPSFTRVGYRVRSRLFDWDGPEAWSLAGRTVVVTGPTSGLGREAARTLAGLGAHLVLVGRDPERLAQTAAALPMTRGAAAHRTVVADLSSLASVRTAADEILATEPRLDVLIDNAGAMFMTRSRSVDGFEQSLATMVLGPFVLVSRLLPRLLESPDPRLVAVASGGQYTQALHLDDLDYERGTYDGPRAYARAKRAQVALVREWSRRYRSRGLTANAMHPGWADTPGLEGALPGFRELIGDQLRTAAEGVDTTIWLAAAPEARASSGRFVLDRRPRPFDRVPSTRVSADQRRALWDEVVRRTGERPAASPPG